MKPRIPLNDLLHVLAVAIALASVVTCATGCFVPPTANMQSARTMDPEQFRLTPYWSPVEERYEGDSERIASDYGALLGTGVGPNTELQLRYDRIDLADDGDGYNFTSFGPKIGAVEDVLAFTIPVGLYWGGGIEFFETIQVHPGAVLTAPVNQYLEINTAGKLIFPLNADLYKWGVVNLGLSLSTDVSRWAILPEVGFAWNLSESDASSIFTYGIAIAFYPTRGGDESEWR